MDADCAEHPDPMRDDVRLNVCVVEWNGTGFGSWVRVELPNVFIARY